eukprot:scaffold1147_cov125-Isochrysis_galbana.AAC.13
MLERRQDRGAAVKPLKDPYSKWDKNTFTALLGNVETINGAKTPPDHWPVPEQVRAVLDVSYGAHPQLPSYEKSRALARSSHHGTAAPHDAPCVVGSPSEARGNGGAAPLAAARAMAARPGTGTTAALMAGTLRERLPTGCGARGCLAGHTSRAVKTDAPPKRLIALGADNRPTGTAGYDDPSRWDNPNAAARCQTPADLTGASGADRAKKKSLEESATH